MIRKYIHPAILVVAALSAFTAVLLEHWPTTQALAIVMTLLAAVSAGLAVLEGDQGK